MKFGVTVFTQHPLQASSVKMFEQLLERVEIARKNQFDSVWAGQHYLTDTYQMFQPIPTLSRVMAVSGNMNVGCGVILLPLQNPVNLAEQIATIDIMSKGRFIFGVGLGYRDIEFESFGISKKERVSRFVEALEVIRSLWTEDSVSFKGRHFTLSGATINPKPVQKPHPPIWIAANSDRGVKRAAEIGDAWLINPHATISTLERQVRLYKEILRAKGKDVMCRDLPLLRGLYAAKNDDAALNEARPYLERKFKTYLNWGQDEAMPSTDRLDLAFEELRIDRFIIGGPDTCIEEISRYQKKLGVTHMIFPFELFQDLKHSMAIKVIKVLGQKVIPYFKETS